MNYALAKELEDAGFPQRGFIYGNSAVGIPDPIPWPTEPYHPTLSELIEACGIKFKKLWRHSNGNWSAHAGTLTNRDSFQKDGTTPEEAVARLWLALNRKEV